MLLIYKFCFDFLAAGCAMLIFKKLHDVAALIDARYHQCFSAPFAGILYKSTPAAMGAGNVERPSAARANLIVLLNAVQTLRAGIAKRTVACAFRTETRACV